ncbi:DUF2721 domain-containing protein [Polymorphobacter sp.]|uniref:DUF2721 domain-containing protein n=1 Tax=Polymorphobacter sp. TaxID=1909290 RepID=UPI003F71AA56
MMGEPIAGIAQNIQLAVTPVFLLTAIGALLNVLITRLGRVVDRARQLEDDLMGTELNDERRLVALADLSVLDRRMGAVNMAIALCTASAFLVCIVIAILFVGELVDLAWATAVVWFFIGAVALLAGGLGLFLAEIRIALTSVRVRAVLLSQARPPAKKGWREA